MSILLMIKYKDITNFLFIFILIGRKKRCGCTENGNCLAHWKLWKNVKKCRRCQKDSDCPAVFDKCVKGANVCSVCGMYALKEARDPCKDLEREGDTVERFPEEWMGEKIVDVKSNYSHIRVRERENKRSLIFVDSKTGEEMFESLVDTNRLYEPGFPIIKTFLGTTLLLHPSQNRVLILGLGGGSLVHFYQKFLPEVHLDIVEIDPAVKSIAHEYFGVNETWTTRIYSEDAFDYIHRCEDLYDVIYLDTFLEKNLNYESRNTIRLKTLDTLQMLKNRLTRDKSLIAFNIITESARTREDISAIQSVFGELKIIPTPTKGNIVGISLNNVDRPNDKDLIARAAQLDARMPPNSFSFNEVAEQFIRYNKEEESVYTRI